MKKLFLVVGFILTFSLSSISLWASGETETPSQPQSRQQPQQTAQQQTSIQGTWEMQTDRGLQIISFIDDTFTFYVNGQRRSNGIFTIGTFPLRWGIQNTGNPQKNILFMFSAGNELDAQGFTFEISANELRLSSDGIRTPQQYFPPGTYRKSSFVEEETGNFLIGVWKLHGVFQDGTTGILRFFPNGKVVNYDFNPQAPINLIGSSFFDYEFSNSTGTGKIVVAENAIPFTVNGNVLWLGSEGASEYRKR